MPRRDDYKLKYYNLFIELRLNLPALGVFRNLELNRSLGLLLHDHGSLRFFYTF
jgi:hypothetical protein